MTETLSPLYKPVNFDPFSGPEISQVVPMTDSQTEIWLSCTLGGEEGNKAYIESNSLKLRGDLDIRAIKLAVDTLVKRHESLRCSFSGDGKSMIIYTDSPHSLQYDDFSHLDEVEQKVQQHLGADASHVFDIVRGPLFKTSLLKLSRQDYLFTFTAHHLIIDGWSIGVIMEELGLLYSAEVQGKPQHLPSPKPFSEYAKELGRLSATAVYQKNLNYWLNQHKETSPILNLPTTYARPKAKTYASNRLEHILEKSLVASLRNLAVETNCTFVNVLMTAFEVYLNRLTGQKDIILGLPAADQAAMGYYDLVGHCVNLLPIRSHIDEGLSYSQYLSARKSEIYDAYEHQHLTFGTILKKLKIARDASRVPLVPVAFNVDFGTEEGVHFQGLEFEIISNPKAFLNFEIFLNVNASERKTVLEWSYNKQLFDQPTAENHLQGFEQWLKLIVANPHRKIRSFPLQSRGQQLLATDDQEDFSPDLSSFRPVHQLIDAAAYHFKDKVAAFCNQRHYTYTELYQKANQFSHYLISKGLKKGEIVAIIMDRSIDTIIAILGTLKAGGAYLPIDTDFPPGRIEFMLQDSSSMHIVDSHYSKLFKNQSREIVFGEFASEQSLFQKDSPPIDILPNDAAYVIYTSGSTGNPKGVILEHRNLYNFLIIVEENPGISHQDRFLAVSSISFDIAILEVLLPYVNGAQSFILDKVQRKNPEKILEQIEQNQITHMFATPSHWKMLLDSNGWKHKISQFNVISGGEPMSQDLANRLMPLSKSLWNIYGPTETTVYSTIKQITPQQEIITIGKPVHNTWIYILDENLQHVGDGEAGELFIAGEGVARGYLNRPELTIEKFLKDPYDGAGKRKMYRTGDVGRFSADGEILILGRADFQVKIRGHRVELGEIEQALLHLSIVRDAVVLVKESAGNSKLTAYLVLDNPIPNNQNKAYQASSSKLIEWNTELQKFLPSYMLPSEYIIISTFPLTASGKKDRKALALTEIHTEPEVPPLAVALTEAEKMIAEIWENALGITNIDITHDFFEIGGHSMIAVQVMTALESKLKIKLPISVLFESPTIQQLAKMIESKVDKNPWSSLVPIKPSGNKIPLYIVHGGGMNVMPFYSIAKHLDADQPLYGLQAIGLNGKDEIPTTIEEIASQYVREILSQNPTSPYVLAGYSLGGIIAFEMAQQFKRMGKETKALILFDTYAIRSDQRDSRLIRMGNLLRTELGKRWFDLEMLLTNPKLLKRLKKDSLLYKARRIKNLLKIKDEPQPEILKTINRIRKIHIQAGNNYEIRPYEGEIYLFRAKIRTSYSRDFQYFGWRPFVKKVNVIEMEGEHTTMFDPPHEQKFVRTLQGILNNTLNVTTFIE